MNNSKDYLANELINQKYFASMTDVIDNPNHENIINNTINGLPPKKQRVLDDRPLYKVISGAEKFDSYEFLYRHFHNGMYESTFFTANNLEKIKSLFPGKYTLISENTYINQDIKSYEQLQDILVSNRQFMNWVLVKKTDRPLLIENKKITLSLTTLFVVTEKSVKFYLYDKGLILMQNEVKTLPDDFVNLFGNTFWHDKVVPKVKDILRKGIGKFEKTLIRENGMRFKKNFLLYLPIEVLFEVDMNYNVYLQGLQNPKKYISDFNQMYTTDMDNMITEPDAPNGFNIIINDTVYIPPAPEEKKVKKTKNLLGTVQTVKEVVVDDSYVGELKKDTEDSFVGAFNDLGDFKWVLLALIIIAIFAGVILTT